MIHGLTEKEELALCKLFARYEEVEEVILYGSRAKGNYKAFSDIDITLVGPRLTRSIIHQIATEIDDLLLPYQCDLSIFHQLTNPELKEHIKRVGIPFFRRKDEG